MTTSHVVTLVDKEGERAAEDALIHLATVPIVGDFIEDIAAPGFGPGEYEVVLRRHAVSRGTMYASARLIVRRL
jgi:hypothetical protein